MARGYSLLREMSGPRTRSKSFFDPGALGLEFCSGKCTRPAWRGATAYSGKCQGRGRGRSRFLILVPWDWNFVAGSVRGPHGAGLQPTQGNVRAAAAVEV